MSPPDLPGYPRGRLPSVREVDATGGAPHTPLPPKRSPQPSNENVEFRGRGWSANIPAGLIGGLVTAFGMWIAKPAGVPENDSLRQNVREVGVDQRAQEQTIRELSAKLAQTEQTVNLTTVRQEATNQKLEATNAKLDVVLRTLEELKRKP